MCVGNHPPLPGDLTWFLPRPSRLAAGTARCSWRPCRQWQSRGSSGVHSRAHTGTTVRLAPDEPDPYLHKKFRPHCQTYFHWNPKSCFRSHVAFQWEVIRLFKAPCKGQLSHLYFFTVVRWPTQNVKNIPKNPRKKNQNFQKRSGATTVHEMRPRNERYPPQKPFALKVKKLPFWAFLLAFKASREVQDTWNEAGGEANEHRDDDTNGRIPQVGDRVQVHQGWAEKNRVS